MKFCVEPFSKELLHEAMPLLQAHWKEVAMYRESIPLNIDVGFYESLARQGKLICLTARDTQLVGYACFMITGSPHYLGTTFIRNDVIYLDPEHRGITSLRFVRECERVCQERPRSGPTLITWHSKLSNDFGQLLTHLGYDVMEQLHGKLL